MNTWEDATSYSRGEKNRTPSMWRVVTDKGMRVFVHRHIHYAPDQWLLSCYTPDLCQNVVLKSTEADEAKREALDLIQSATMELSNSVGRLIASLNQ
jgi:hypothetical protein